MRRERDKGLSSGVLTPGRSASVVLIATSQVLAMALWFSASAVLPALRQEVELSPAMASLFTSAVQMGFVVGTLVSAVLGLADRVDPRRLIGVAALSGALANASILLAEPGSWTVVSLRFLTGVTMAGVYPVGIKLVASWARGDMGLLVGLLVAALTLGSASPHLFHALGGFGDRAAVTLGTLDWRWTLGAASVSAIVGAALIQAAGVGPNLSRASRFDPRAALHGLRDRALRLANLGYLGHMWELYAMWTWIGVFLL
ncbi:MAG: MFS transporter, partial [Gammaproteobacteria bacterium]|nr:MFS transporter [Gammaproteobacteria bacterium]